MKCQRLQKLIKNWYAQVQDEAMAPARMIAFMERHLGECPLCLADPKVKKEVAEISAFVMPAEKVRKPEISPADAADEADEPEEKREDREGTGNEEEQPEADEEPEPEEDEIEDDDI